MSILDAKWKYSSAEESRKPGYLKARFAAERKRLREQTEKDAAIQLEKISKVRAMTRGGR